MARYLSFVISLALASVAALQAVDQNRVTFDPNDFPVGAPGGCAADVAASKASSRRRELELSSRYYDGTQS